MYRLMASGRSLIASTLVWGGLDLKSARPRRVFLNSVPMESKQYDFHVTAFRLRFELLLLCSSGLLCKAPSPRCSSLLGRNGVGESGALAIRGKFVARSAGPSRVRCILGSPAEPPSDTGLLRED